MEIADSMMGIQVCRVQGPITARLCTFKDSRQGNWTSKQENSCAVKLDIFKERSRILQFSIKETTEGRE